MIRSDKPKVFVFRQDLLPYSETFVRDQVLACQRWKPVLLGLRCVDGLPLDGIETRRLLPDTPAALHSIWKHLNRQFGWAPPKKIAELRQENAQLIHTHFGIDALAAWPLARALNLPMMVTLHGYDITTRREWWEQGNAGRTMRRYPERLLQVATRKNVHFVAVSRSIRQAAIDYGIPADRVSVSHIGVDVTRFTPGPVPVASRDPKVLFIGRLVEKKGLEHLIRALAQIAPTVPALSLVVAGDGPLRGQLKALAYDLGVRTEFLGAQPPARIKTELDAARVFCLPSVEAANGDAEGFGMVLLEAQACGVPVISSARGGAEEGLLEGITGFAHAEGCETTLADRLRRVLTNDTLAQAMSDAAPGFVRQHFDLQHCARDLETLYDQISAAD